MGLNVNYAPVLKQVICKCQGFLMIFVKHEENTLDFFQFLFYNKIMRHIWVCLGSKTWLDKPTTILGTMLKCFFG